MAATSISFDSKDRSAKSTTLQASTGYLDTPPPSSPRGVDLDDSRMARSSSVTAIFSSSPARPAEEYDDSIGDQSSSYVAGSSPTKHVQRARVSFGSSYATTGLGSTKKDPHAGLEELSANDVTSDGPTHVLYGSYTHALLLGRCKPTGAPHASCASGQQDEEAEGITPTQGGLGTKPTQHVSLPNNARHVSRRHAIVEWLPFIPSAKQQQPSSNTSGQAGGFVVRILGQNGLIVEGKRRREGHVLRLEPGRSVIDFFGVKTQFAVKAEAVNPACAAEETTSQVTAKQARGRASLPAQDGSSPVKKGLSQTSRSASSASLPERNDVSSQAAVSQLLGPSKHTGYVKSSKNPQMPPSPPSSSPAPPARQPSSDDVGQEDAEDSGAEQPTSPTATRGRTAAVLFTLGGRRIAPGSSSESEEEDVEEARTAKVARKTPIDADAAESSSDESDLTPSPTPSPVKPRPTEAPSKPVAMAPPSATISRGRPLQLTTSQQRMPPPELPASATREAAAASSSPSPSEDLRITLRDRARAYVAALSPTYDLEGLLAGAIVFHRTATISASEAVRSVLSSNQGLMRGEVGSYIPSDGSMQQGKVVDGWSAEDLLVKQAQLTPTAAAERWSSIARRAWTERLELVLCSNKMFGQIQRAGKDASGNSLEHWYYYDPKEDEDRERAANLGSLVKPIRGALKTHKPIFWKKSDNARRQEEDLLPTSAATNGSTASASTASKENTNPLPSSSSISSSGKVHFKEFKMSDSQISPPIVSTGRAASLALLAAHNSSAAASAGSSRLKNLKSSSPVDEKRIWQETQPEEREQTWDRLGDMDWQGGGSKRKRK